MPTTPTSVKGMVAVSTDSGLPILGYITWYSIPDEPVGLRRLKASLAQNGLPPTLAPKDTKAIDVFKRAMREQEGRHKEEGVTTDTAVEIVTETGRDVVYQISQIKKDVENRVVDYPKALRVIFNKETEQIGFNPLGEVPRSAVLPIMEAVQEFYDKNATKVTGARVRSIIRLFLKSEPDEQRNVDGLGGENLRGKAGGIYFVPARHVDSLSGLSEVLHELYHGKAYLHAIPMANGDSEREIVRRHHVANTREEMRELLGELRPLLDPHRERNPRTDVIANKASQFRAIERRAGAYKQLLADEIDELDEMAGMVQRQINKLV